MTCDDAYDSDGRPINHFAVIRGAMQVLNFTEEEQWNIWTIVALVMHLGNVVFGGEERKIQIIPRMSNPKMSSQENILNKSRKVA